MYTYCSVKIEPLKGVWTSLMQSLKNPSDPMLLMVYGHLIAESYFILVS